MGQFEEVKHMDIGGTVQVEKAIKEIAGQGLKDTMAPWAS